MKKTKKILGTIVFLAIGIVIFVHVSYLLRPTVADFRRSRLSGFYAEEEDSLDIVALGSSSLYRYLDNPYLWENYGFTSYNLATPRQSILFTDNLVDELKKTQDPQLVVVEIRQFITSKNEKSNSDRFSLLYDNMKYSWNRIKIINKAFDTWQERISAYFDIIAYHDTWEDVTYSNMKYMDNVNPHKYKGWDNIGAIEKLEEPEICEDPEPMPISEFAEKQLIELMEKCRNEKVEVLFVATPWQISEENQRKNCYIGNLVEEYGFKFLDCNQHYDEMGLDFEKDFYNAKHTNTYGADKVTKLIGDFILENYDLNVTHSQEVTDDWNEMLERYHTDLKETEAEYKENLIETKDDEPRPCGEKAKEE